MCMCSSTSFLLTSQSPIPRACACVPSLSPTRPHARTHGRTHARTHARQIKVSDWDVSLVTSMCAMFQQTITFSQNLSAWDVSRVETMASTFKQAVAFNGDISTWDVSSATIMHYMFAEAKVRLRTASLVLQPH